MFKQIMSFLVIAGFVLALAPAAQAVLITGVTATASSEIPGRVAANAVNGSGLTGSLGTGSHDGNPGNAWEGLAGTNTTGWLSVDLGAIYDVDDMYFWNGGGSDPFRGVGTANIYYSTLESPDTSDFTGGDWTLKTPAQAFTVLPGGGPPYSVSDTIALNVTAQHIALDILSNHGNGGGVTGVNEVQFDGELASTVPDPIVVGVNFDVLNTSTQPVPANEVNGVVPAINWNNAVIGRNPINPTNASPFNNLTNSDGDIVPGLTFSWTGNAGSESWNTNGSGGGRIYGDFVIDPDRGTLTISGIPENDGLQLFTYHNGFNDDLTRNIVDVTANGITLRYDDHLWDNTDHGLNPFLYTEGENYLEFDLAATDTIEVTFAGVGTGFNIASINAFQLVITPKADNAIPEPATATLAMLGLGGLLMRRRRRAA